MGGTKAYISNMEGTDMAQPIMIFDLDHTVICSRHRQLTRPDGSLCLESWRVNSTREKIFQDSLLPLAGWMRRGYNHGAEIIICTARVISEHDLDFLDHKRLKYHHILARDGFNDNRPDAMLKVTKLTPFFYTRDKRDAVMFDDNQHVLAAVRNTGIRAIDAIPLNQRLAEFVKSRKAA